MSSQQEVGKPSRLRAEDKAYTLVREQAVPRPHHDAARWGVGWVWVRRNEDLGLGGDEGIRSVRGGQKDGRTPHNTQTYMNMLSGLCLFYSTASP